MTTLAVYSCWCGLSLITPSLHAHTRSAGTSLPCASLMPPFMTYGSCTWLSAVPSVTGLLPRPAVRFGCTVCSVQSPLRSRGECLVSTESCDRSNDGLIFARPLASEMVADESDCAFFGRVESMRRRLLY